MPRLRQVPRSEATDEVVIGAYTRMFGDRDPVAEPGTATGTPGNWWTVFALVPDVLQHAVRGFGLYRNPQRALDPALRELAQTRAGWLAGSQFVFSQHCKACRAAGIDDAKIAAIPSWTVSDLFDAKERAVLSWADCLAGSHGRADDATFEALRTHLNDQEVLELTYITSMYIMHATITRALRLEYDDRPDPIVEVPAPDEGTAARDIGADIAGDS